MKTISCLNPQIVYNRYIKKVVVARCGKCAACFNARSANWVQRLDQEMYYSKYTWFVTFQYDEQNVMQIIRLRKEDNPDYPVPAYINSETGEIYSLKDVIGYEKKDVDYCYETKVLLIPYVRDFQLFMKLLRKEIQKRYALTKSVRYFCAFEIGPTTYRPHAHCLFFSNSDKVAQNFGEMLDTCWKYGRVFDPHLVTASASSYVASYLNCFVNLPKIYLHKGIRPKALFSRNPPIGFMSQTFEARRNTILACSDEISIYDLATNSFCNVPLWRSLRDRLFPSLSQFDTLTYLDRIEMYRLGEGLRQERITESDVFGILYGTRYFHAAFVRPTSTGWRYNEDSFKRFIRTIKRAAINAYEYGLSIEYYVYLISEFYDSCKSHQLREYYLSQQEYFKSHPVSDFIYMNPEFCQSINGKMYDCLSDFQKSVLTQYSFAISTSQPISIDYRKSFAWQELNKLHAKIRYDNTKTKEATDYLMSKQEHFQNIINYKNK